LAAAPSNDALGARASDASESRAVLEGTLARLRPAFVPALVLFAVLVHLPIFSAPRFLDDYNQQAMIEGTYPSHPGPFDLYDFITDANRRPLMELGILPWWSHPSMELRFLRPLSSALLSLDHAVFGAGGVFFCHLHSFFWWALACWAVFALVRELFSRRVAVVAALIFAVAPCHGFPLSWMANREELISTSLGTLGLLSYVRWRERRLLRDGLTCFALFATAILSGEYTLCFAGYLLAIEATLPRESIGRRITGLACFVVPALAYLATRHALHYGAFGTGYYHDPLRDFGAYAAAVPRRLAVLFVTAWIGIDDRLWVEDPGWKLALLFVTTVALLAIPASRVLAGLDRERRRRAHWLLAGSVLAIAPVIAVGASVRLLEIPMVGVSAGVALLLDGTWFPPPLPTRRAGAQWAELVVLALAFVHLVRAPLDSWLMHRYLRGVAIAFDKQMTWLHDKAEGKEMVIVVRANLFQTLFVTPLRLDGKTPARDLTFGAGRILMLRTAPRSLELVGGSQPLFPVGPEDLVRNSDVPLHPGDTVELPGMRATILALRDDGTPRRLAFEFDHDLDDPSYLWVAENASGFEEIKLPSPGHGEPLRM
jgi:hypothetical protein